MKVLVLSDVHSRVENVKKIAALIHNDFDFALFLGDLTNFGDVSAKKIIQGIGAKKCFAIPGNLDSWETLQELQQLGVSIHGKKAKLGAFDIVGFGGGLYGHGGRILFKEAEIAKNLKLLKSAKNAILATHLPPKNTPLDIGSNGEHLGSQAVMDAIEEFQPEMHLCGHIHEATGETKIGNTASVNAGAVKDGRALLLELGKKISFKRIGVQT